ncbi:uncharacterized protein LOC103388773 [Cynoglossus semilaevis]|uniref:uncharacterized protein LOC103388773 n=1 Tax=Cynoglossus semilaevis TaxID=244447 RepID=UPI000497BD7C|nr:uncharacterized protein LOC103388773 [Cynoglossus semilaevis]XP_016893197.1 uncharacterized protein LOC103388773 [Cynoglossus semilaevis]
MEKRRSVSSIFLLLLALLQLTTPSSGYSTRPANVKVAVGEPAEFKCGVPEGSSSLVFTFYSSHGNYSITCPEGHVEDIPQALFGSCDVKNGELLSVWRLQGTSYSDNGTKVECRQSENPEILIAILHVYDDGTNFAVLIGCTIGAFFGILLVFGLSYTVMWRSERLQRCFGGNGREEDLVTIVTNDQTEEKTEESVRRKNVED